MKIDFWFDINEPTKEVVKYLQNIKEKLNENQIQLRLRSLSGDVKNVHQHYLVHLARRSGMNPILVLEQILNGAKETDIFNNVQLNELNENNELYENIVKNQQEHSEFSKVENAPFLCLSHKVSLTYPFTSTDVLDAVNEMIERDRQVEYCYDDDDCLKSIVEL